MRYILIILFLMQGCALNPGNGKNDSKGVEDLIDLDQNGYLSAEIDRLRMENADLQSATNQALMQERRQEIGRLNGIIDDLNAEIEVMKSKMPWDVYEDQSGRIADLNDQVTALEQDKTNQKYEFEIRLLKSKLDAAQAENQRQINKTYTFEDKTDLTREPAFKWFYNFRLDTLVFYRYIDEEIAGSLVPADKIMAFNHLVSVEKKSLVEAIRIVLSND